MKKLFIFTLLINTLVDKNVYGQHNFNYDFQTCNVSREIGKSKNDFNMLAQYKKPFNMHIVNINTFLYKVTIDGKTIDNPNALANDIFTKNIANLNVPIQLNGNSSAQEIVKTLLKLKDDKEITKKSSNDFINAASEFTKAVENLQSINNLLNGLRSSAYIDCSTYNEIEKGKGIAVSIFDSGLKNCTGSVCIVSIQNKCDLLINKVNEKYNAARDAYNNISAPIPLMIVSLNTKIGDTKSEVDKASYPTIVQAIINLYNGMVPGAFEVYSATFFPNQNEMEIDITIEPRTDLKYGQAIRSSSTTKLPINIYGGVELDFSGGIAITSLVDKKSVLKPIDTTIVDGNTSQNALLATGLLNLYYRTGRNLSIGLNLGIGVPLNSSVKYLTGLSIILGRSSRFVFNGGFAVGTVKVQSEVQKLKINLKTNDDISYSDVFKIGSYFGISYNILK